MAGKKILITEQEPEEEAAAVSSVDEAVVDEPAVQEEPSTDTASSESEESVSEEPLPEQQVQARVETSPQPISRPRPNAHLKPVKLHATGLKKRRRVIVFGLVIVVLVVGIYFLTKSSNPLPAAVKQKANFGVYYPGSSSSGYTYLAGSANYSTGKLMYALGPKSSAPGNGGPYIRVSEEALNGKGPNLNLLEGYTVFKAPAGEAAAGMNGDVANGVVVTKKTLIILNGLNGVSKQDIVNTINSM